MKNRIVLFKTWTRRFLDFLLRPVYSYFWWRSAIWPGNAPLPRLESARHLVVIRPDEIGDFILMSPFLRELRRSAPQARITLMLKKSIVPLAKACPYVDDIVVYDWEQYSRRPFFGLWFRREAVRVARKFTHTQRPDLILLPRRDYDLFETELLAHAMALSSPVAKCRSESSYYAGFQRIFPRGGHVFENSRREHEVTHSLRFLEWLGAKSASDALELWLSDDDEVFADRFLTNHRLAAKTFLVLHPSGGRSPLKQWPRGHFVELLARLQQIEPDLACLIIGGPEETWIRDLFPARESPRVVNAVGALHLTQLAAVLKRARFFVGGDSGPMHLAAAAGVPVLALFGSTHLQRYRPHGPQARVITLEKECSPAKVGSLLDRCWRCVHHENICLTEMTVEGVLQRLRQEGMISSAPGSGS